MKIVLYAQNASRVHTNLAVRCLRDSLEEKGFPVTVIEKNGKDRRDSVLSALVGEKADVYCFSAYIWNVRDELDLAKNVKALLPGCLIVFGGPEVSFENEAFFDEYPFVDHVIAGEGETVLPFLCADPDSFPKIVKGTPDPSFSEREGIAYRDTDGISGNLLYYESSRGCPYRCAYCLSGNAGPVRAKSVEQTLADLNRFVALGKEIGVVKFVDRTFNFDRERAYGIWSGIPSDYLFRCHFEICASLLDDRTLDLLSGIGPDRFQFEIGVQSTNPETRKAIRRTDDLDECLHRMEELKRRTEIPVHADLIAGLPYEGMKELQKSFDTVFPLCDVLQLGFLKLLKGSALREEAKKYGIVSRSEPPYTVLSTKWLSFEELTRLKRTADVLDRIGNSGSFRRGLEAILEAEPSPFAFFLAFADALGDGFYTLSQREAYERLLAFAAARGNENGKAAEALALDFLTNETGKLPNAFRNVLTLTDPAEKAEFFRKEAFPGDFSFRSSELYTSVKSKILIDRASGKVKRYE